MDRQPDGGRFGPFDTVPTMGRDQHGVARDQATGLSLIGEPQVGRARQDSDPFGMRLVVLEARRARLTG